jgi:hypothetical protein
MKAGEGVTECSFLYVLAVCTTDRIANILRLLLRANLSKVSACVLLTRWTESTVSKVRSVGSRVRNMWNSDFECQRITWDFEVAHEFVFVIQVNLMDCSLPVLIRNCSPYVTLTRRECIISLSVVYTCLFSFTDHLLLQFYYTGRLGLEFSGVLNTFTAIAALSITDLG